MLPVTGPEIEFDGGTNKVLDIAITNPLLINGFPAAFHVTPSLE